MISTILNWNGGLWENATDWNSARLFVVDVIQDSQGLTPTQRQILLSLEEENYLEFYRKSASGSFEGIVAYYSETEIKNDIAGYAISMFDEVKNMDVPEQVKLVFASFADTTDTIGNTQGKEFINNEFFIPNWLKIAGVLGLLYVVTKK
jgi:hypothetical protein